jgi:hypothetical protein
VGADVVARAVRARCLEQGADRGCTTGVQAVYTPRMPKRLRSFVHRLLLLLMVVTATRGATWSHECVMPAWSHASVGAAAETGSAGHGAHAGHAGASHAPAHHHDGGGSSRALSAAASEVPLEEQGSEAPHGDCTCIGECCAAATASVCARCEVEAAHVRVARVSHGMRDDADRLPPPPAHLHPFANGPPAASLA